MFLLNKFPRELCYQNNRVKIASNKQDVINFINQFNGRAELHTTVYSFGSVMGTRGNYREARIDKVFVDIDAKDREGNPINVVEESLKLFNYLNSTDYYFSFNFSGRGTHFFVYTKEESLNNKCWALKNYSSEMFISSQAQIDPSVTGDLAREVRLLNTINTRSGLHCIPLTKEDLDKGIEWIHSIAKMTLPLTKKHLYGKKLLSLSSYDSEKENEEEKIPFQIDGIDFGDNPEEITIDFDKLKEKLSIFPCMKDILEDEWAGNEKRLALICKLRQMGLSVKNADYVIKKILCKEKIKASPDAKRQARDVYKYGYKMSNCDYLMNKGVCPLKDPRICKYFDKLAEVF
jgi:hypothetical protein